MSDRHQATLSRGKKPEHYLNVLAQRARGWSTFITWNMDRPLSLPEDTDRIVAEIVRRHSGIVIIHPAPTLLDRSNYDADVRRSFSGLATACRTHGACLILVRHTNKRLAKTTMDRGGGSIGGLAWPASK